LDGIGWIISRPISASRQRTTLDEPGISKKRAETRMDEGGRNGRPEEMGGEGAKYQTRTRKKKKRQKESKLGTKRP